MWFESLLPCHATHYLSTVRGKAVLLLYSGVHQRVSIHTFSVERMTSNQFWKDNCNRFQQLMFQLMLILPNRCHSTASSVLSISKENFNCSSLGELLRTPFRARKTWRRASIKIWTARNPCIKFCFEESPWWWWRGVPKKWSAGQSTWADAVGFPD